MDKYVIKNCENYDPFLQEPTCNKYSCDCQNCTDCVMKQIVEKCKKVQELEYQKGRLKCKSPSKAKFGREILKLLDIQEVE